MPTYDYKCTQCEAIYQLQHSMSERPEPKCSLCKGVMRKAFGIAAVTFKGEGFHSTDK